MAVTRLDWKCEGVRHKPDPCKKCPYAAAGSGFCGGSYPKDARVLLLVNDAHGEDTLEQRPWLGDIGQMWNERLLKPAGLTRADVAIDFCLRCHPPGNEYPTGWLRRQAEISCRRYDDKEFDPATGVISAGGIKQFNPNLFIVTYHPHQFLITGAYYRQILKTLEKAKRFAGMGFRPAVLMGEYITELMAPWITGKGGIKTWQGHYWEGEWPFKSGDVEKNLSRKSFAEACAGE